MNQLKDPIKQPPTVYNNGAVALGKDLVFGWVVLAVPQGEDQTAWIPVDQLHPHERRRVHQLMDGSPIFPEELRALMGDPVFQTHAQHSGLLRTPRSGVPDDFERVMRGQGQETMQEKMERALERVDGPRDYQKPAIEAIRGRELGEVRQVGDDPNATIVEEGGIPAGQLESYLAKARFEATEPPLYTHTVEPLLPPEGFKH